MTERSTGKTFTQARANSLTNPRHVNIRQRRVFPKLRVITSKGFDSFVGTQAPKQQLVIVAALQSWQPESRGVKKMMEEAWEVTKRPAFPTRGHVGGRVCRMIALFCQEWTHTALPKERVAAAEPVEEGAPKKSRYVPVEELPTQLVMFEHDKSKFLTDRFGAFEAPGGVQ